MRTALIRLVAVAAILPAAILLDSLPVEGATAWGAARTFDGAHRYEKACASCHGSEGEGISAFGAALKGNEFIRNAPAGAIIAFIQQGRYNRDKS